MGSRARPGSPAAGAGDGGDGAGVDGAGVGAEALLGGSGLSWRAAALGGWHATANTASGAATAIASPPNRSFARGLQGLPSVAGRLNVVGLTFVAPFLGCATVPLVAR